MYDWRVTFRHWGREESIFIKAGSACEANDYIYDVCPHADILKTEFVIRGHSDECRVIKHHSEYYA